MPQIKSLILSQILLQDRKGLPELPWPASDVAPEHGRKTLWERKPRWSCPLSGPQRSTGCRIPQHARGLPLPANWLCHVPGQCMLFNLVTHSIFKQYIWAAEWGRRLSQNWSTKTQAHDRWKGFYTEKNYTSEISKNNKCLSYILQVLAFLLLLDSVAEDQQERGGDMQNYTSYYYYDLLE